MSTETKAFPVRVVLTVTTGLLLTEPRGDRDIGIGDIYGLLNWMTNDNLLTHQLGRAAGECKPWLFRWFPELDSAELKAAVESLRSDLKKTKSPMPVVEWWLTGLTFTKAFYDVPRIPMGDRDKIDPIEEAQAMFPGKVIVIKLEDE